MKTTTLMLTIHKTFLKDSIGERDVVLFVSDGSSLKKVRKIVGDDKVNEFVTNEIGQNTTVRSTAVSAADVTLIDIHNSGARIEYAHWHSLGIEKSLEPDVIAFKVSQADAGLFREFTPDKRIVELRRALGVRNALLMFYGDAVRRIKGMARNTGNTDYTSPLVQEDIKALDDIRGFLTYDTGKKTKDGKVKKIAWMTRVEQIAETIPECSLFARIAGFSSLGTAASIVAIANGIERFPDVASFWSYCGQGVVDGKAPKRKTGVPVNWSPKARTTIYNMMSSIVKDKNNPWNPIYYAYKEQEMAVHAEKHPDCKAPKGHCHNRAMRKVAKEILKRFYLEATNQQYMDDHRPAHVEAMQEERELAYA